MKFCIISADGRGQINGVCQQMYAHIPQTRLANCDAVIVPVSDYPNYTFNETLHHIHKPIIVIDFIEYAWNWDQEQSNLIGDGSFRNYGHLNTPEWEKLDTWFKGRQPNMVFKRELLKRDENECRLPIEWPCLIPARTIVSEAEFNARKIEVFNCWGFSHVLRRKLHGDIFIGASRKNYHVIDHWDDDIRDCSWVSIHVPYQRRRSMDEVMKWNSSAKLSVSLHGAGVKCFRHGEAAIGSVMALQEDKLAWSVPWEHGVNCVRLKFGDEFESLFQEVTRTDLYQLYLASQDTVEKLRPANYVPDYLLRTIKERM